MHYADEHLQFNYSVLQSTKFTNGNANSWKWEEDGEDNCEESLHSKVRREESY